MDLYFLLPTLSTSFILISAILVAIGWALIIKGKKEAHKKVMISGAIAAILFFIIYMSRTIFVGNTEWGGPENLKGFYQIFLIMHIILATVAAVFGITTLTLAFKEKFAKHRKWGKVTAIMWFFTAITGATVYSLLYLLYPGGHTKPVWEVILGI
ncbi:DUF420 domain-containing protein [Paenibacillus sp. CMAA1364]